MKDVTRLSKVVLLAVSIACLTSSAWGGLSNYRYNSTTQRIYALTDNLIWTAAQAQAVAAGTNLVSVNDAAENGWLSSNYGSGRWIGYTDQAVEGTFAWIDGSASTYTNWNSGEPNNSGDEDYTEISGGGRWNDLNATQTRQGILRFPNVIANAGLTNVRYSPATNRMYALTSASATWEDADLIAKANGKALTTVNNSTENNWLRDNMLAGNRKWIGLNDKAVEGTFVWTDGDGSAYRNWNGGEPNNSGNEDCVEITTGGGWNDMPATATTQGIVEWAARGAAWRFNPASGKLNAQTDSLPWADANAQAQAWGGRLVTIRNAAENEFVRATFGGGWIGYNDKDSEGAFTWAGGEPTTYTNWNSGEPNNSGDEDYAEMVSTGKWNDLPGSRLLNGVAEKNATRPYWVYNAANGKWYAKTDNLTWNDARAQARSWGADLATVNDAGENEFVRAKMGSSWIGINDAASEGTWTWSAGDGGTFTPSPWGGTSFHKWAHPNDGGSGGEPNGGTGENYGEMRSDGFWNDLNSTSYRVGVAEADSATMSKTLEWAKGPNIDSRYTLLGLMTWAEAEAAAQALGGHLVTVRDMAENAFLQALAQSIGQNVWLGLNDQAVEGQWDWAGTDSPFTNWAGGEPNNSGNEDYAMMLASNGLWNDAGAGSTAFAVVETVPEPCTLLLIGSALAGLGVRIRRRIA